MISWKNKEPNNTNIEESDGVVFLTFQSLKMLSGVVHGFSTRIGGVSEGDCASMNLGFGRGDDRECVDENYRRMARALQVKREDMVLSHQTHTANVRVMTEEDRGKGIVRPRDYQDVDGMVTNVPGLILVTMYADCVPLFFVDPVKKAVGLSHSGWKGTVQKIGAETVRVMKEQYGTRPQDLTAVIGPSICQSCYEVGEYVAGQFRASFSGIGCEGLMKEKGGGKYLLDLREANVRILKASGLLKEHVYVSGLCTSCGGDLLWSHRKTGGRRGGMCAFLGLKEK